MRTWSWTRIDGRNVMAIPTHDEIHLYDSDDFILIDTIVDTGHQAPIQFVRWSAFHGKLASVSAEQLMVHAPRMDASSGKVTFVAICDFNITTLVITGVYFSRCTEQLVYCGSTGMGILDVHHPASITAPPKRLEGNIVWEKSDEKCDVAKFSPSAAVLASLQHGATCVKVWRLGHYSNDKELQHQRQVVKVDAFEHSDPVVYFSWKPATSHLNSADAEDEDAGKRKAHWFESPRILLTCTARRTLSIWIETTDASSSLDAESFPSFTPALRLDMPDPIDNFRWVLSKNRNISEEKFQMVGEHDEKRTDWISGVDRHGVLHLWRIEGVASSTPALKETEFRMKVNGDEDHIKPATVESMLSTKLEEICVMAYFSQDYFGMPSKFDIVLQRADNIILSYDVAVGHKNEPSRIKKKSWYRSHIGTIAALAAHPSLPLVASVDVYPSQNSRCEHEILIYWLSFSAFSAESRLIPSGVLQCAEDSGEILCIQWIPTLHFDATPLLLVAYASGTIDIYGRAANAAGVVTSPKNDNNGTRKVTRSPIIAPWTYYDFVTGESGVEHEVAIQNFASFGEHVGLENKEGKLTVTRLSQENNSEGLIQKLNVGDEIVAINSQNVMGKDPNEVYSLLETIPHDQIISMRFRANSAASRLSTADQSTIQSYKSEPVLTEFNSSKQPKSMDPSLSVSGSNTASPSSSVSEIQERCEKSVEECSAELHRSFLTSLNKIDIDNNDHTSAVVHAGSVSIYGGWCKHLNVKATASLALVCACPVYADDGEFVPDAIVIFALATLPGTLCAWKGLRSNSASFFTISALHIQDQSILRKHDITSIAGERDYRQRAFSSKHAQRHESMNSLLFVGDVSGAIEHWRCRITGDDLSFTRMSSFNILEQQIDRHHLPESYAFYRRGYFTMPDDLPSTRSNGSAKALGVRHIEVDDPNRIAVLHDARPHELNIFEAESGLGILRLEEIIQSSGRGAIVGFCWCNAHVEFNVDAIAVNYTSGIVVYQYDMMLHRWTQIGDDITTPLAIFDCTRDSSALLIGGGRRRGPLQPQRQIAFSNEMPVVMGKWDEPGNLLQYAMDWKAAESPQKLPVWHPYVIITTLFGMHARVGVKDTMLAGDKPTYEFSRAFKDAVQMLKLLTKVIGDDKSARLSARTGILSYYAPRKQTGSTGFDTFRRRDSIGRYSTSVHRDPTLNKAVNIFGRNSNEESIQNLKWNDPFEAAATQPLSTDEESIILAAIDSLLQKTTNSFTKNGSLLFASFANEHLLEMKAVLNYVMKIQGLGFDLDASAADLGGKRYYSMFLFAKSMDTVICAHKDNKPQQNLGRHDIVATGHLNDNPTDERLLEKLSEVPSSGILWALHSDAQPFLCEHCISPQATWEEIKPMWLGLWIKDVRYLRGIIERLAKSTYTRNKNAMEICLYYIALGKKNILGALARLSKDDKDKNLSVFLEHNFSQERWSNAAVKNAYSLLSKKQYEAAAAFFLLCEPPRLGEALRVLVVRHIDLSLALIIARLVEYRTSDSFQFDFISSTPQIGITAVGEFTRKLLEEDIIPLFRQNRDRWLESCALWWLEDFEQAGAVLLPQSQAVDVSDIDYIRPHHESDLFTRSKTSMQFYINLTSIPLYFQYLHTNVNSLMVSWAMRKLRDKAGDDGITSSFSKRIELASTADIEHAFSFCAYVCKRSGLSDTALVEMLQARHLVNTHARFEIAALESDDSEVTKASSSKSDLITSPRFRASMRNLSCRPSFAGSPNTSPWKSSPRRRSDLNHADLACINSVGNNSKILHRSSTVNWTDFLLPERAIPAAPWLKAQIADIECRRWSSSAFVGKMIGIRVAREMISHFRAELYLWFRNVEAPPIHRRVEPHKAYLEELCAPLCEQFQIDRKYVIEAALAVMQPHAYLHIVEVCFLLSELGRLATLQKWILYVSVSMLYSCSTFASCKITEDVYRDWEGLTIQLCYILNLDAQGQICLPPAVTANVAVAVRTGCICLSWCRHRTDIVHEAISFPFFSRVGEPSETDDPDEFFGDLSLFSFEKNMELLRKLQQTSSEKPNYPSWEGSFGYTFLKTVASQQYGGERKSTSPLDNVCETTSEHQVKLRKMYTLILMVSVLRTHYARAQVFLGGFHTSGVSLVEQEELDIANSLFTPKKLWKDLAESPLEGIKRWYGLIESHLRCEFDYSVKEIACLCGLYGLDGASLALAEEVVHHDSLYNANDKIKHAIVTPEYSILEQHHTNHRHQKHEHCIDRFHDEVGINTDLHRELIKHSDDYVLLMMRHPHFGIAKSRRRFRVDPRVHLNCFLLKDAFHWFTTNKLFPSLDDAHKFLSRCCKQRKLRLLVSHQSEDCHLFPSLHHHGHGKPSSASSSIEQIRKPEHAEPEPMPSEVELYQAMMFVDPWEVEAEYNVRRYMHNMAAPAQVELGWDRFSPLSTETCDDITERVLKDPELVEMWKSTRGEGWLVTSITQYQLDGVYSRRVGHTNTKCVIEEDQKVPFLVEIHLRSQRNAMFKEVGLPHRFVGVVKVTLIEGRDLISCGWMTHSSDAYVFLELSHTGEHSAAAETWNIQTYRSRVGDGGTHPRWDESEDSFTFRFAIPTHRPHIQEKSSLAHSRAIDDIWNANTQNANHEVADALETLFQTMFTGPATVLHCSVYHKNKLFAHQFMGRGTVPLNDLTSGNPLDCWVPLQGVPSGKIHLRISLCFQLMCSVTPLDQEMEELQLQ